MDIETYQMVFTHEQATASIGTVKGKLSGKDHVINQEKLKLNYMPNILSIQPITKLFFPFKKPEMTIFLMLKPTRHSDIKIIYNN